MAVIVTDMDMPSCCAFCEFGRAFDNESCLCTRQPDKPTVPYDCKPEWCTLKEQEPEYSSFIIYPLNKNYYLEDSISNFIDKGR